MTSLLVIGVTLSSAAVLHGQTRSPEATVVVPVGKSTLMVLQTPLLRVSIPNVDIAEAVVVSPSEILVNGKEIGTTSLVLWGADGSRRFYSVEVTVDSETLARHIETLFPDEAIDVTANGTAFILSGEVTDRSVVRRVVELAEATGSSVIDNMRVPVPKQILLQVRFAEVSRTAMEELGVNILRVDPFNLRGDEEGAFSTGRNTPLSQQFLDLQQPGPEQTFSDAVNFYVFDPEAQLGLFIRALQTRGLFRSLAEPNLLAADGEEASFLAGGEFPFPVVQGGSSNSITIVFKEFGIRLRFVPRITNSGNIKLHVAPEVSSLDFGSGLNVSGFQIPALLSRKAETEVELRDGQTFAIAGLIDNSVIQNADHVPILGSIPILGALFRSKDLRQSRSELLVLVTPRLVQPTEDAPPVPTGEPDTWEWKGPMKEPVGVRSEE